MCSCPGAAHRNVQLCDTACHPVCMPTKITVAGTALGGYLHWEAPVISSDFSPASVGACPQNLQNLVSGAEPHCEHTDNEAAMADSHPSLPSLTMGLLWWAHSPSCMHPQLWPGPHSRPLRMSLCTQTKSAPCVCLQKPEFQHSVAAHAGK